MLSRHPSCSLLSDGSLVANRHICPKNRCWEPKYTHNTSKFGCCYTVMTMCWGKDRCLSAAELTVEGITTCSIESKLGLTQEPCSRIFANFIAGLKPSFPTPLWRVFLSRWSKAVRSMSSQLPLLHVIKTTTSGCLLLTPNMLNHLGLHKLLIISLASGITTLDVTINQY